MTIYWCRFFDRNGRIDGAEKMEGIDDADVISKARTANAAHIGSGYEIWDDKRLVERVKRSAADAHSDRA